MSAKPESLLVEIVHAAELAGHTTAAQTVAKWCHWRGDFDGSAFFEETAMHWQPSQYQQLLLGSIVGYRPWVNVDTRPFAREVAEQLEYENRWGLEPPCDALRADLRQHARDLASLIEYPHAEHTS